MKKKKKKMLMKPIRKMYFTLENKNKTLKLITMPSCVSPEKRNT